MIGKVIGAFVGDRIAKQTSSVGGATGAALGVAATSILRRMSLPAMIAVGAGGYVAKKIFDKKKREEERETLTPATPVKKPVTAQPAAA